MTALVLVLVSVRGADAGPAPSAGSDSLVVGPVTLERENIFTRAEVDSAAGFGGFLRRLSNHLHATTRSHVLQREFLFREGAPYRPDLLDETERNLRALGFLASVTVAPQDTGADGRVPVLVATRESWTLKTDVTFALDAGGTSRWTVQMSDANFLGYGVTAGVGLGRDLTGDYWNLWYRQRRVAGSGLSLGVDYGLRDEGHFRKVELSRPFYALDDPAAVESRVWDTRFRKRFYLSNAGPAGIEPAREASLYAGIPFRDRGLELGAQRRLSAEGRGRIWRLGAGARVQERRFSPDAEAGELSDGRIVPLDWLTEPGRPYAREQGTDVFPYLWLRTVSRSWVKAQYLIQYGGLEDVELGWDVDIRVGPAGGSVGSTTAESRARWRLETRAQRWLPAGPGYALLLGEGEADLGSPAVRNHRWDLVAGWMTAQGRDDAPWLTRVFIEAGRGAGLSGARPFLLGVERGLRTLAVDGMAGDRLLRANLEVGRATALRPLGLFRLGVAAFGGAGSAWWADEARTARDLRREVGVGLRFGPVRAANAETARLDVAWPLDGGGAEFIAATGGLF